jgi:hypothetical protein
MALSVGSIHVPTEPHASDREHNEERAQAELSVAATSLGHEDILSLCRSNVISFRSVFPAAAGLHTTVGVKSALIQATEEDPSNRFASAAEFLEALQNSSRSIRKTTNGRSSRSKRSRKRTTTTNGASQKQKKRYPIPELSPRKIEDAMEMFDREHRTNGRWRSFEINQKHRYAIEHNGERYPVKKILSLATGLPVDNFSGGSAANKRIQGLGFRIVKMRADEQQSDATIRHSVDGTNTASLIGSSAPDDVAVRIEASD